MTTLLSLIAGALALLGAVLSLGFWSLAMLALGGLLVIAGHTPQIPAFVRRYVMLAAGLVLGTVYGASIMAAEERAEHARQIEVNRQALFAAHHAAAELQSERAVLEADLEEAIRDAQADPAGARTGLDRSNIRRLRGINQARP